MSEGKPGYYAVIPAQVRYDAELRPNAKLLYGELTALAGPDGYCWASDKYFAELFGLSPKTVNDLIQSLRRKGYIRIEMGANNRGTERHIYAGAFFVAPSSGEGIPENGGILKNADTPGGGSPEKCGEGSPHFSGDHKDNNLNNLTNIPPVSPVGGSGGGKAGKTKPVFPPEHEAYRCAKYLDGAIRERLPKKQPAAEATLQSWAADFDKCRRLDGYDWKTVMDTLIFSQTDEFWQSNILSGRKFRQKLLQLMAKMQRVGRAPAARNAPDGYMPEVSATW